MNDHENMIEELRRSTAVATANAIIENNSK